MDVARPAAAPAQLDFARGPWSWGERSYVMAILNATPDSFSGDGLLGVGAVERTLAAAELALAGGADILDLGGESTRPGAAPVRTMEPRLRPVSVRRAGARLAQ